MYDGVMAITYSSAIQSQIARQLTGHDYSALKADEKALLDGTWTTGSLAEGNIAYDVLNEIRAFANFFAQDGADEAPATWLRWFVAEVCLQASQVLTNARPLDWQRMADRAKASALATYTRTDVDATATTEGLVISHLNIRRYMLHVSVRQDPPAFPAPELMDAAIRAEIVRMWNHAWWTWRRKQVEITIATNGSVTAGGSEAIHAIMSKQIWVQQSDVETDSILFVGADDMAYFKASSLAAGQPQTFRMTRDASGLVFVWDRTPDQEYTANVEIILGTPDLGTSDQINTALGQIPPEFLECLRECATASLMDRMGRPGWMRRLKECRSDYENMLHHVDGTGQPQTLPEDPHNRVTFQESYGRHQTEGLAGPQSFGGFV